MNLEMNCNYWRQKPSNWSFVQATTLQSQMIRESDLLSGGVKDSKMN